MTLPKFYGFLTRHGSTELFLHHVTVESFLRDLCLFQSWCYVGLYVEFFRIWDIQVNIEDLAQQVQLPSGLVDAVITTQTLPTHLLGLEAKTRGFDMEDEDEVADQLIEVDRLMTTVQDFLSELDVESIREMEWKLALEDDRVGSLFDIIYLSVAVLGEALVVGARFIQAYPRSWEGGPWLEARMLRAGWCRSEVFSLLDQCGSSPSTLYYLGCLDGHSMQRQAEHQYCGNDFRCNLESLDLKTYETRHSFDCNDTECQMLVVDRLDAPIISNMVLGGKTPLITVCGDNCSEMLKIVDSSALQASGESHESVAHLVHDRICWVGHG